MINHLHGDPTATMLWEWLPVKPMTFYDHVETLRLIRKNQYWRALVLKDYGVQEWNLVRQGQTMERSLPLNWETALLEHCCRREVFGDNMIEQIDCYNHWVVFLSLFPCDLCKGFFSNSQTQLSIGISRTLSLWFKSTQIILTTPFIRLCRLKSRCSNVYQTFWGPLARVFKLWLIPNKSYILPLFNLDRSHTQSNL